MDWACSTHTGYNQHQSSYLSMWRVWIAASTRPGLRARKKIQSSSLAVRYSLGRKILCPVANWVEKWNEQCLKSSSGMDSMGLCRGWVYLVYIRGKAQEKVGLNWFPCICHGLHKKHSSLRNMIVACIQDLKAGVPTTRPWSRALPLCFSWGHHELHAVSHTGGFFCLLSSGNKAQTMLCVSDIMSPKASESLTDFQPIPMRIDSQNANQISQFF